MRRYWWLLSVLFVIQCSEEELGSCRLSIVRDLVTLERMKMIYDFKGRPFLAFKTDSEGTLPENGFRREFKYDDSNRIVRMDEFYNYPSLANIHEFEYSGNQIIQKVHWTPGSNIVNWMLTYTIDSEGKVIQLDQEGMTMVSSSDVYEYQGGNIVKATHTSEYGIYIQEYEYDNRKNPFKGHGLMLTSQVIFSFLSQNENNYIKVISRWGENSPISGWDEFKYEYNSHGYPVKKSEGLIAPYTEILLYTYECEQ